MFDASGREIFEETGESSAGKHTVMVPSAGLSQSVYFVQLKTDDFTTMKKVILLK
jgi:hypothetical protein